jgi:hypothetical protein
MANRSSTADDLEHLTRAVEDFCRWIEHLPAEKTRAQEWGPREVLAHLVYWHEHYLAQSEAILAGKAFPLPAGRFRDLNVAAVEKLGGAPPAALCRRFRAANRRLCTLALADKPGTISFRIKQGSKRWRLADLLRAVEAHVRNHLQGLKKEYPSG